MKKTKNNNTEGNNKKSEDKKKADEELDQELDQEAQLLISQNQALKKILKNLNPENEKQAGNY